jgi:two-component system, OmpR family, sensor histidine kinase CiaH
MKNALKNPSSKSFYPIIWLRSHGYHILFSISIISLAALVAWWSVFIKTSIERVHEFHYDSMSNSARFLALSIGHNRTDEPALGVLKQDNRLEIVHSKDTDSKIAVQLAPFWQDYAITPRPEYIAQIEGTFHRQNIMVIGESSVLFFVIIVCILMLYRIIFLERRASRELKEFWSRITHEIKTPITGIKAFLQTLQKQDFTREELEPLVRMALREVERQEMLAENLLVGQRIQKEGLGLKLRPFILAQRVTDFFDEHQIIIPPDSLTLEVDCSANLQVNADPDALWVILENLIDNALKYGGKSPLLKCCIYATDKCGVIEISDTGIGFDPAHADKIFEAYQRLTDELPIGRHGTGMGLYLSRRLARKMGGNLTATSKGTGKGASFILTLKRVVK